MTSTTIVSLSATIAVLNWAESLMPTIRSAEIAMMDADLATDLFARDPAKATALSKSRAKAADALARAEEAWLSASAEYENAMA